MDQKTKIEKLEKIVNLNLLMNQANDLAELLNVILTESENLFNVAGTSIFLEDKDTGKLFFYIATGKKKYVLKTIYLQRCDGIRGYVFNTGKVLLENDPEVLFCGRKDKSSTFAMKNILCLPLKIQNKIIGVIELVNKKNGDFSEDDVELLRAVSSQISITLERARLIEEKIKSERLATIGDTIAGLSHYIKNILNGLRCGEFIINKNIKSRNFEKLVTGWKIIQKNINKISTLVLDMLQYSKVGEPRYILTDINTLITDVSELLNAKIKAKKIDLTMNLGKDVGDIEIDPIGIYRCILNLFSNSIEAFKRVENKKIELQTILNENDVHIIIKDNGCGITKDNQEKLFTKYFSTKGLNGTGLGLPITKKIIEDHKGRLQLKSEKDIGTVFTIILPRKRMS